MAQGEDACLPSLGPDLQHQKAKPMVSRICDPNTDPASEKIRWRIREDGSLENDACHQAHELSLNSRPHMVEGESTPWKEPSDLHLCTVAI